MNPAFRTPSSRTGTYRSAARWRQLPEPPRTLRFPLQALRLPLQALCAGALRLICVAALVGIAGCGRPGADQASGTGSAAAPDGPPGFLDPAPPMPDSDTLILSGGTLLGAAVAEEHPEGLFDAVVVVRDGTLIGFGRRGAIDVPADSVGIDTSGQFIEPVGTFTTGAAVTLNVYGQRPQADAEQPALTGRFADGRWQPVDDAED
ncbi:MAG: hypothetical protein AAGG11_18465 [Pseudomonadota bacterium]